ncbi:MAG: hypothetical protein U0271_15475 [Polyangiaceae bacterium]
MKLSPRACLAAVAFGAVALVYGASCTSEGTVVFGVRSGLPASSVASMDARFLVGGDVAEERTLAGADLDFPLELRVTADDGQDVAVELSVMNGSGVVTLSRRGSTRAAGGRDVLYEMSLEPACSGVECGATETCIGGTCKDPFEDPAQLSDYFPEWSTDDGPKDRCEPGGDPTVIVGEGQADYHAVSSGQVLQVEAGPQGGYHVWIAARIKNLKQSGSIIELGGRIPAANYDIEPMILAFTFDPDEGDFCKIYGLRFRLDDANHPIESLLGLDLSLTMTITDKDGDVGVGTLDAKLSDSIL